MNQKISSELFIPFHCVIVLAEQVINLTDELHIQIEKVDCKCNNKKRKDNTEDYQNNFHIIYPVPSGVHIQPHRVHP